MSWPLIRINRPRKPPWHKFLGFTGIFIMTNSERHSQRPKRVVLVLALLAALLLVLARPAAQTLGLFSALNTVESELKKVAADGHSMVAGEIVDTALLLRFYEARKFEPVWDGNGIAVANAKIVSRILGRAEDQGLDPSHYHQRQLAALQAQKNIDPLSYDLLLTDAALRYVQDLGSGQISPSLVYDDVSLPQQSFDVVQALADALTDGTVEKFLAELPPPHSEYAGLVAALAKYRALAANGGWAELPAVTLAKNAKTEEPDPRWSMLAVRLAQEYGDLLPSPSSASDGDIASALKSYQARNGLDPDGKLGTKTLAMLNISAAERVSQILANMERWRWMPRQFEPRYILVNVADASLQLIDNGREVLWSKVIVGKPSTPTPLFRAVARAVTVNPPWNVPRAIAVKEILPKLRRDPNYLASQHMILVDGPADDPHGQNIDWKRISPTTFPYQLRQVPGADNALGTLKLELPNAFNVYLHDTPSKTAFAKPGRDLSHGCVRVQQILPLASLVLADEETGSVEALSAAIATGETQSIALKSPLPVYIVYWTALAGVSGNVEFRPDVYGRDRKLIDAMQTQLHPKSPLAMNVSGCKIMNG